MSKALTRTYPLSIQANASGGAVRFTPEAGRVFGCSIYHNNEAGTINPGTVRAKITYDDGSEVVPMVNIKHFRNRDASYFEGFVPLNLDTQNRTFVLTVEASEVFTDVFTADLVLAYENNC